MEVVANALQVGSMRHAPLERSVGRLQYVDARTLPVCSCPPRPKTSVVAIVRLGEAGGYCMMGSTPRRGPGHTLGPAHIDEVHLPSDIEAQLPTVKLSVVAT